MARDDPETLFVQDILMDETIDLIKNGIYRKLAAARHMIDYDKEIAAGIYVYALEELGKLLVLKKSKQKGDKYAVKYSEKFLEHEVKFSTAFGYLRKHGHPECIILKGSFSKKTFGDSFSHDIVADTEARLGIFYVDFECESDNATKVKKIPYVNEAKLKAAIVGLEDVMKKWA